MPIEGPVTVLVVDDPVGIRNGITDPCDVLIAVGATRARNGQGQAA